MGVWLGHMEIWLGQSDLIWLLPFFKRRREPRLRCWQLHLYATCGFWDRVGDGEVGFERSRAEQSRDTPFCDALYGITERRRRTIIEERDAAMLLL